MLSTFFVKCAFRLRQIPARGRHGCQSISFSLRSSWKRTHFRARSGRTRGDWILGLLFCLWLAVEGRCFLVSAAFFSSHLVSRKTRSIWIQPCGLVRRPGLSRAGGWPRYRQQLYSARPRNDRKNGGAILAQQVSTTGATPVDNRRISPHIPVDMCAGPF